MPREMFSPARLAIRDAWAANPNATPREVLNIVQERYPNIQMATVYSVRQQLRNKAASMANRKAQARQRVREARAAAPSVNTNTNGTAPLEIALEIPHQGYRQVVRRDRGVVGTFVLTRRGFMFLGPNAKLKQKNPPTEITFEQAHRLFESGIFGG